MRVTDRTRTWHAIRKIFREGAKVSKDATIMVVGLGIFTTLYHELRRQQQAGNLHLGNIPRLVRNLATAAWQQRGHLRDAWAAFLRTRRAVKRGITAILWTIPVWTIGMFLVAAVFGGTAEILFALVAILATASWIITRDSWIVDGAFAGWLFSRPLGYELNWSHDQAKGIVGKFTAIILPEKDKDGNSKETVLDIAVPKMTGVQVEGPAKFDMNYKRPREDSLASFVLVIMLVLINYAIGIYFMNASYWLQRGGLGLLGVIILSQFGWIIGSYVMHRRSLDYYKWIAIPDAVFFLGFMLYMILGGIGHTVASSDTLAGSVVRATESKATDNPVVFHMKTRAKTVSHDTTFTIPARMPIAETYKVSVQDPLIHVTRWEILSVTDVEPEGVCWDTDADTGRVLRCSGPSGENYTPMGSLYVQRWREKGYRSPGEAARIFFAPNIAMGAAICSPDGTQDWKPCKGVVAGEVQSIQIVAANTRRDWTARALGSRLMKIRYTGEARYEILPNGKERLATAR